MKVFQGVHTALVTPFTGGQVDIDTLKTLLHLQLESGVDGVVVLGTTGEAPTLNESEKELIVKTTVNECRGRIPVMMGVGTNDTLTTIKNCEKAYQWGADSLLVVSPYYNKPTQEGIYQHFKAIQQSTDLPLIVYNIPGRCGVNILPETLMRIVELGNVVAVKEATANLDQTTEILKMAPKGFSLLSGDDNFMFSSMCLGGRGVISVLANLLPKKIVSLYKLLVDNNIVDARSLHMELQPFFKALFIETNPQPIKFLMNSSGLSVGNCRLPLCEMETSNKNILLNILNSKEAMYG